MDLDVLTPFSALQARSSLKLPARQFLNGRPPLYFVKRGILLIYIALHPLFAKQRGGRG
jgi:hypothetical protein